MPAVLVQQWGVAQPHVGVSGMKLSILAKSLLTTCVGLAALIVIVLVKCEACMLLSVLRCQVRAGEMRATVEDLLYMSILEKFIVLGVEMLPRLDGEKSSPCV